MQEIIIQAEDIENTKIRFREQIKKKGKQYASEDV